MQQDLINFQLPHPGSIILAGSTGTGKTHLIYEIIKHRRELFTKPIEHVLFVYSDYQPGFYDLEREDPNVVFTNNIFDIENFNHRPGLIICDDQMDLLAKRDVRELITRYFIKHIHHRDLSFCLTTQNLYAKGMRDINLNGQFLLLTDNPRDRGSISVVARQICPSRSKFIQDAYVQAVTRRPFGYLVIDLHPQNKMYKYFLRSNLFPTSNVEVYAE